MVRFDVNDKITIKATGKRAHVESYNAETGVYTVTIEGGHVVTVAPSEIERAPDRHAREGE